MHKALEIAANMGIETVKQLSVAVGNAEWPTFMPATIGGLPHRPKSAPNWLQDGSFSTSSGTAMVGAEM